MKNTNRRIGGERGVRRPTTSLAATMEIQGVPTDSADVVIDSVSVLLEAAKLLVTEREFMLNKAEQCPASAMVREIAKTHGFKVIDTPLAKVGRTEVEEAALKLIKMEAAVHHGTIDEDGHISVDLQYDVLDGLIAIADAESGADHEGCYDRDLSVERSIEEAHVDTDRKYEY